jgi:hypothetical protein
MDKLILENIRCFKGRHEVPLAPLTLLVGENSTGKTTFLAMVRIAWNIGTGVINPDFNDEPFSLGAFDEIYSEGKKKTRASKFFVVGHETKTDISGKPQSVSIFARFLEINGQPWQAFLEFKSEGYVALFENLRDEKRTDLTIKTPSFGPKKMQNVLELFNRPAKSQFLTLPSVALWYTELSQLPKFLEVSNEDRQSLSDLLNTSIHHDRPFAFSSLRAKPKRTYGPKQIIQSEDGNHIPMVLSTEFAEKDLKTIGEIGADLGLFSEISVRRLGSRSDPFQLQVKVFGAARNIMDVGYGVSQILPILVECSREKFEQAFLIQQPEIHLHPRAQAAIGTFFGDLVAKKKKRFVIETHSDYIIDRVCMDVRDKKSLKPEDVVILYFEQQKKNGVKIFPIHIDEQGNLIDAPPTYRDFFIKESKRFLGA